MLDGEAELKAKQDLHLLVDRLVTKENDEELLQRVADSADAAFYEGTANSGCWKKVLNLCLFPPLRGRWYHIEEPTPDFFNQNNPYGARRRCGRFWYHHRH